MTEINSHLLRAETQEQLPEFVFEHPLNPQAELHIQELETGVKIKEARVQISRIPPGQESLIYPIHQSAQEFVYILSGRGIVKIDDRGYEVASGDHIGFPTPTVVHHVCNPFLEDLIYLVGDEQKQAEITESARSFKGVMRENGNDCASTQCGIGG